MESFWSLYFRGLRGRLGPALMGAGICTALVALMLLTHRPWWMIAGVAYVFSRTWGRMTYVCLWCRVNDHSNHHICKVPKARGFLGACRCQFFGGRDE